MNSFAVVRYGRTCICPNVTQQYIEGSNSKRVSLSQANGQLSGLLQRVRAGERFLITVCDRPVAELVPFRAVEADKVRRAIEGLRLFQQTHRLRGLSVRQMIEEGRRH